MFPTLLLFAASLVPAPAGDPGVELFVNGGFEDGLAGWRPLNMSGSTTFAPDGRVFEGGQRSLRIERSGSPGRVDFLKQSAELPDLRGRATVEVSLAWRVNDEGRAIADAYFFDADGKTIGEGYVTLVDADRKRGKFQTVRRALDVPRGTSGVGINVRVERRGTVWIDDVSVLLFAEGVAGDADAPAEGLANGAFDRNLDGWTELANGSTRFRARRDARPSIGKLGDGGALRLERRSPRLFPEDGVRAQAFGAERMRRVRLALVAASEGDARGAAVLLAYDAQGAPLASARAEVTHGDAGPAPAAVELELPRGTARVEVWLTVGGRGEVWFDDVAVEEAGS